MIKKITPIAVMTLAIMIASGFAVNADPPECDKTFVGSNGAGWETSNSWDPPDAPDENHVVCIEAGDTVHVNLPEQAKAVVVMRDGASIGHIVLFDSLTIHEDSYVDGRIELIGYATVDLFIADDLTITGNGGSIDASFTVEDGGGYGTIAALGGNPDAVLTLAGVNNGSRSTSLVLQGAFIAKVAMVNNAYVVADHHRGSFLQDNPKSGSGYWIAEDDPDSGTDGTLLVEVEVSGSGRWEMVDVGHNQSIYILAECTDLSGSVEFTEGLFLLQDNFETSGELVWKSVDNNSVPTRPRFTIDAGHSARFGP